MNIYVRIKNKIKIKYKSKELRRPEIGGHTVGLCHFDGGTVL